VSWACEGVSHAPLAHRAFYRRTVAEVERNVVKLGKRNAASRLFHSKNDKEKIAAWRLDLNRILHVFNVRSITSFLTSLTIRFQTELAINTHGAVVNTQNIVSDIHRTMVERQGGTDGGNASVSSHFTLPVTE
jgi:hypothetical protein